MPAAGTGAYVATRENLAGIAAPAVTAAVASPHDAATPRPEPAVPAPASIPAATALAERPALPTPEAIDTMPAAPPKPSTPRPTPAARDAHAQRSVEEPSPGDRSAAVPVLPASSTIPDTSALPAPEEVKAPEPQAAPEPPVRALQEVVVPADAVIGLETDTALSSERARIEDRVEAHVVRDVRVNGVIAVPAGSKALGTVVVVERGNKLRDRARLGIRFQTLLLPDGSRLSISTETIYRYGDAPGDKSTAKITGGAVAGAILGAIINGGKGAAIGAAAGAGAGSAAVAAGDRSEAVFPSGVEVTARILAPLTVTLDK